MTEVGIVMTLQAEGTFHNWIQSLMTYWNLSLVALHRAK